MISLMSTALHRVLCAAILTAGSVLAQDNSISQTNTIQQGHIVVSLSERPIGPQN